MRITALSLALIFVVFGCSKKDDVSKNNQSNQSAAVAPDNTGRNERDRDNATKTAGDQSENEADRTIPQNIRQAIVADDSVSTNGEKRRPRHSRWRRDTPRTGEKRNREN